MRRIALGLLVVALMRVTFAYADTNSPITIQNFFLGDSPSSNSSLNQVLALLIGPEGKPGPAGVAGRDGFIGMNGENGKDGLPGAPGNVGPRGPAGAPGATGPQGPAGANGASGATGPQGPAGAAGVVGTVVVATNVAVGSSECSGLGGTKFTTGTSTTFACNGSGGSGGGGTFGFGQGTVNIGTCDGNASVSFTFPVRWSGSEFFFKNIGISDVDSACSGATLRVYLKVKGSGTLYVNLGQYDFGDVITCSLPLTNAGSFTLNQTLSCARESSAGTSLTPIDLGEIGTRDLLGAIGFEIA